MSLIYPLYSVPIISHLSLSFDSLLPLSLVIWNFSSFSRLLIPTKGKSLGGVRDRTNAIYLSYFLFNVPATLRTFGPTLATRSLRFKKFSYIRHCSLVFPFAPSSKLLYFSSLLLEYHSFLSSRFFVLFFFYFFFTFLQSLRTYALLIHVCAAEPCRAGRNARIV